MHRSFVLGALVSSFGLVTACGSDEASGTPPVSNEGGLSDTGGAGSGGATSSGGSRAGGSTGRGGSNAGGANVGGSGASNTGGSNAGGVNTGGFGGSNTGGANVDGGSGAGGVASGGTSNDAGLDGSSGAGGVNTGGASGSGGSNTGGTNGSGGSSTGGSTSSGGSAGTGGASTGGAQNDGGPTGNIFVNPTTGDDNNSGLSSAQAVKTIAKGSEIARTLPGIETILLEDGTYDSSTQSIFNVTFPAGTTVRSNSSTGVTVRATNQTNGFRFTGGGALRNVTFDTFSQAVQAIGTGTFDMSDVHFVNVSQPLYVNDSVAATVDASDSPPAFAVPPTAGFGLACIVADGTSNVMFKGGAFQNIGGLGNQIFLARGHAKLTIDGAVFDTMTIRAITIQDNADVVLMNSQIHRVSVASTGLEVSTIFMGGQNTQMPLDQSLELVSTDITMNQTSGIGMVLYGGMASKPTIRITSSHIENNDGNGFGAGALSTIDANLVNAIQTIDSTFKGNTLAGLIAPVGTVSITGGEFSGNGGNGIGLTMGTVVNSLKVRGTVKIDDNGGHGISFSGATGSSLDLGKTADPGGITFTNVDAAHSAVSLQSAIQGFAVGNTWMPNVQGASAAGAYTSPTTIVGLTSGLNAFVASGGSLVVAE
jgi:hypothetical protein